MTDRTHVKNYVKFYLFRFPYLSKMQEFVNVLNFDFKLKTGFVPKYVNLFEIATVLVSKLF